MKKLMILLFFSSLFIVPSQSLALSCAEPTPADIAIGEYDAVVIGAVKGIESSDGAKKMTVEVEKSFKGVDVNKITVYEDITWGKARKVQRICFS